MCSPGRRRLGNQVQFSWEVVRGHHLSMPWRRLARNPRVTGTASAGARRNSAPPGGLGHKPHTETRRPPHQPKRKGSRGSDMQAAHDRVSPARGKPCSARSSYGRLLFLWRNAARRPTSERLTLISEPAIASAWTAAPSVSSTRNAPRDFLSSGFALERSIRLKMILGAHHLRG